MTRQRSAACGPTGWAVLALMTLVFSPVQAFAQDFASPWSRGEVSSARMISAGGLFEDHAYRAGMEIELKGMGHTYWRNPGDSGVPPVISFAGSSNLAAAELSFPAPKRLNEAGGVVYGYRNRAVLPIRVLPADPAKPVELAFDLRYAACDRICVPAEARGRLTLSPTGEAGPYRDVIMDAGARVPRSAGPNDPKVTLSRRDARNWHLAVTPLGPDADLFAEGPEGWYFDTKASGDGFDLILAERPGDAGPAVSLTLTLTGGNYATEQSLSLDVSGSAP